MPYITDIIKFLENKIDKKNLKITNSEEDIFLLKVYVKKLRLNDNIRIKELNRILSVKDLLILWLRFRTKFNLTDIAEILSIEEEQARSLIGNALINITQIDLTSQDDKCFFTSAKLPFYLSTEGKIIKDLNIADTLNKHIKSCKYCKNNFDAFKDSINKISNLPILEQDDTEYVLYHKSTGMKVLNKLFLIILALLIISGLFVSPSLKKDLINSMQNNNLEKNQNTQKIKQIKKEQKKLKTDMQKRKTQLKKEKDNLTKKTELKTNADTTNNEKQSKILAKTKKTKSLAINHSKKLLNNKKQNTYTNTAQVTKFTLSRNFKNSSQYIKRLLSKYKAKHFGDLKWGSNLNNGAYFHLIIKEDNFDNFKKELIKLADFTIINRNSKNQKILSGYKRAVIWISYKK